MGFLLPSMTQQKLDNQRDVVKNERRESVDNVPYGQAEEMLLEALYPGRPSLSPQRDRLDGRPVGRPPGRRGGVFPHLLRPEQRDPVRRGRLSAANRPGQWIEKYFGPLPRGPEVEPPQPSVPKLADAKHIRLTDAVSLPRAQLIWPTVPADHPDEPALDVLAAVLGGLPKENRLFRALMYDRQLAARSVRRIPPTCSRGRSRSSCMPGPAKSSTSWSRSPTPRSSGSRRKAPLPSRSARPRTSGRAT